MMMFAHFEERKGKKKALVWIISVVKYLLKYPENTLLYARQGVLAYP